ncbi:3-hydroxyacyl-CoA dehydrogenase NAD-binding domain-containing protein [Chelatococcus asaccharovorans]|uniref:3-hydroxyacyl-CoA dehydrogenase-like protein n=1 Tax=Chelatococcus asaccharovorans TaxID=28210 RepID=A0A2V3UGA8_9HYPH|nr:3-hydroxyacyl-CoA dehydrogenase NAD-binding domain-containing protein [Chelatococcus asaccharovorans]MBS7701889.1 hypothetical protein [Chelatococcus asaccharovorans]PXW64402.1 3-hydroxyacyl-CoA dehydrogenase-like protein [Chelatococcus asaccharovorans]
MAALASAVCVTRHGAVAAVIIDHAPVNALSKGVRQGLLDAVRALDTDASRSAIVLGGGCEAAFEDMGVKTDIFRRPNDVAKAGAVLATNTSYFDLERAAAGGTFSDCRKAGAPMGGTQ